MYIDREGNLRHETSPSISDSVQSILSPRVSRAFLEAVAESMAYGFSDRQPPIPSTSSLASTVPGTAGKRAILQSKRGQQTEEQNWTVRTATIPINNKGLLRQYYEKVFQNLQQTNCRVIAKLYVKLVEPYKQAQYPYNGRKYVTGRMQQFSPEETKPPWWPPGVTHREPDHLPKSGRFSSSRSYQLS